MSLYTGAKPISLNWHSRDSSFGHRCVGAFALLLLNLCFWALDRERGVSMSFTEAMVGDGWSCTVEISSGVFMTTVLRLKKADKMAGRSYKGTPVHSYYDRGATQESYHNN